MPYPDAGTSCPVSTCGRTRRMGHLMCSSCWRKVSPALQRLVLSTWSNRLKGEDAAPHEEAKRRAIAAVEAL